MAPTSIVVTLQKDGRYTVNNKETPKGALNSAIRQTKRKVGNEEGATLTIVAEKGVKFDKVVELMNIANRLKMRAILATRPADKK